MAGEVYQLVCFAKEEQQSIIPAVVTLMIVSSGCWIFGAGPSRTLTSKDFS